MKAYVTLMCRWGDRHNGAYVLGAFSRRELAERAGEIEAVWRGGKYEPLVIETPLLDHVPVQQALMPSDIDPQKDDFVDSVEVPSEVVGKTAWGRLVSGTGEALRAASEQRDLAYRALAGRDRLIQHLLDHIERAAEHMEENELTRLPLDLPTLDQVVMPRPALMAFDLAGRDGTERRLLGVSVDASGEWQARLLVKDERGRWLHEAPMTMPLKEALK